mmetsp:Transcript_9145/g.30150  ORF Transcript_9145/g.30150 Transcript_9145/m.30150 type:complete len:108 (+) Transcript_9145:58-381(+)
MPVEFPTSARAERPPTPPEPETAHESEGPTVHADGFDAEAAREAFRLRGKAGHDRVLESLKKEATALKETRQYLFGRLLNLQLEEAVLRDHLNRGVNEPPGEVHDGA